MTIVILIALLGADDWRTREKAQAALEHLGPVAHSQLLAAEHSADAEIAHRASVVIGRWYVDNAERLAEQHERLPCISGNYIGHYLHEARQRLGWCNDPDLADWRLATRLYLVDLYRARIDPAPVLEELWRAEREWVAQQRR